MSFGPWFGRLLVLGPAVVVAPPCPRRLFVHLVCGVIGWALPAGWAAGR
ncbi:hypothetical protein SUDANB38_03581 [Streptomyces sp. enrichment culture]